MRNPFYGAALGALIALPITWLFVRDLVWTLVFCGAWMLWVGAFFRAAVPDRIGAACTVLSLAPLLAWAVAGGSITWQATLAGTGLATVVALARHWWWLREPPGGPPPHTV